MARGQMFVLIYGKSLNYFMGCTKLIRTVGVGDPAGMRIKKSLEESPRRKRHQLGNLQ